MMEINEFIIIQDKKNKELGEIEKKSTLLSTLRVILFILGSVGLIVGVVDSRPIVLAMGILAVIFFIILIFIHGNIINQIEHLKNSLLVVERYIDRYSDKWRSFKDTGEEYCKDSSNIWEMVAKDLDLLGVNSLYQMISICNTVYGKEKLSDTLKQKKYSEKEIKERQNAIDFFQKNIDYSMEFEALGIKLKNKGKKFDPKEFSKYCSGEDTSNIPLWIKGLRFVFPLIEIILCIIWIIGLISYIYPLAGMFIGVIITWFAKKIIDNKVLPLFNFGIVVEDYKKILKHISKLEFDNTVLQEINKKVAGDEGALNAISELNKISSGYNICFNPLVHWFLNGVLMWDFHLISSVVRWKDKYGKFVDDYFDAIGQMEEIISLSVIGIVRGTCKAKVIDNNSKSEIICKSIKHPLLMEDKVVPNDLDAKGNLYIITGSNMSGKTTFLRTVAINLMLAYAGAPVCASYLCASYAKIFTSMGVTDDVANGISTFYAEILRIKSMSEYKKTGKPMICFIDEIFKGTNSADRIVGAREVITKLANDKCVTFVSTHDFELCDIQGNGGVKTENYHFEEYYINQELKFDYKIRAGRCTTTNAMYIIKMAGF